MIKFPAQYHSFRKTTLGDNLITLLVDGDYSKSISELVEQKIGTQYVIHLEDVTQDTNLHKDPDDLLIRFRNKLHVMIAEYATMRDLKPDKVKDELRKVMINKKLMVKSTTELDIKGLAVACNVVEEWINKHGTIE